MRRQHRRYRMTITPSDCRSLNWIESAPYPPRFSVHQSVCPAGRDDRATEAHRAAPRLLTRRRIDPVQVHPPAAGRVTLPAVPTPISRLGLCGLAPLVDGRRVRIHLVGSWCGSALPSR
jgi:hypothetical protein